MIVGDIGTLIEADTGEALTSGTNARMYYVKPSGTTGYWDATVSGTKIQYTTVDGDLDEVGVWSFQGYVELGTTWYGRTLAFSEDVGTAI